MLNKTFSRDIMLGA